MKNVHGTTARREAFLFHSIAKSQGAPHEAMVDAKYNVAAAAVIRNGVAQENEKAPATGEVYRSATPSPHTLPYGSTLLIPKAVQGICEQTLHYYKQHHGTAEYIRDIHKIINSIAYIPGITARGIEACKKARACE